MSMAEILERRRSRSSGGSMRDILARRRSRNRQEEPAPVDTSNMTQEEEELAMFSDPERARDSGRAFWQGVSLGTSDEIEAAARAAGNLVKGDGFNYDEQYQGIKGEMDAFARENPREAMLSNLSGGMMTMPFGGSLKTIASAKSAPQMLKNFANLGTATRTGRAIKNIGTGAGIGALAGYASGDGEDRLTSALTNSLIGGGLGATGELVAGGINQLANRRVARDLVDKATGEFTPLRMAAEKGEAPITSKLYEGMEYLSGSAKRKADEALSRSKEALKDTVKKSNDSVKMLKKAKEQALRDRISRAKALTKSRENQIKNKVSRGIEGVKTRGAEAVDELGSGFRQRVISEAQPAGIPAEEAAKIAKLPPNEAAKATREAWDKYGFKAIGKKSGGYNIDKPEKFESMQKAIMDEGGDPYLDEIGKKLKSKLIDKANKEGVVSAEDMMEARNYFARKANSIKGGQEAAVKRNAYNRTKRHLDEMILEELDDVEKAEFLGDLDNYRKRMNYNKASLNVKPGSDAGFTPAEYDRAIKMRQPDKWLEGAADLQDETRSTLARQRAIQDDVERGVEAQKQRGEGLIKTRKARGDSVVSALESRLKNLDVQRTPEDAKAIKDLTDFINRNKRSGDGSFVKLLTSAPGKLLGFAANPLWVGGSMLGSRALTSKAGQKLAAGQTGMQQKLRDFIKNTDNLTGQALEDRVASVMRGLTIANAVNNE